MRTSIEQLKREALAGLASLDTSLANMPPLEPDVEAMVTAPAATVAGSVNLLDATMDMLRKPAVVLAIVAANLAAQPDLDEAARLAVEGEQLDEVA